MTDAKSAWHETGERFNSLGSRLKVHYEQKRGQDADEAKAEVRDALHRLTGALDDAFEAIGSAARDDAVKSDVKQVGQSLVTALGATFNQISAEVQRQYAARTGSGAQHTGAAPADGSPPDAASEPAVAEPPAASEPPAAPESPATPQSAAAPESPVPPQSPESSAGAGKGEGDQQPPKVEPWGTP